MNFHYTYSTKMIICFDNIYEVHPNNCITLDEAREIVENGFIEYGFDKADVIDAYTGEVLVMADND